MARLALPIIAISSLIFAGCPSSGPPPPPPSTSPPASVSVPVAPAELAHVGSDGGVIDHIDAAPPETSPRFDVAAILFPDAATTLPGAARCAAIAAEGERARCSFGARYEADPEALRIAWELYESSGDVAGVQVEQDMDGGFRGRIHLVPEPPMGKHRRHLAWIAGARRDFDAFFAAIAPQATAPVRYRHRPLAYRFFRSVGRTTPSAYAEGWTVSYNVSGSLHASAEAVRDTIFHEVFHLNDQDHDDWSKRALGAIFDAIVARCGTRVSCLRPYAPGDTMVRGGTYYAFQPDNGESVHEYAAELALRYFIEQRAALAGEKPRKPPFKCGPEENRRAWAALIAEFFGGADATPPCPG
ncbi:Hypothetical protein A7982_04747 [Minicystis rosea]|nr:Hypothetical protein A7982_04747 [Minicystis rosea]